MQRFTFSVAKFVCLRYDISMKILLSNDDGIDSIGIAALLKELAPLYEVMVSAPATQQSAVSKALTLYNPLRATPHNILGYPNVEAFAVSGTPVDCIRLGLGNLLSSMPDIAISGINVGHNIGTDTLYSGTCAAAQEAAVRGIPAIALSCCSFRPEHIDTAAKIAHTMIQVLKNHPLPFGAYYNVNVPDLPMEQIKGIRQTKLGIVEYENEYIKREDNIGRDYYWAPRLKISNLQDKDTDERWSKEGWVTVTPLTFNNAVTGVSLEELTIDGSV